MSSEAGFFAANDEEFSRVLAGWQFPPPPLPEPVAELVPNPFGDGTMTRWTRRNPARPEPSANGIKTPAVRSLPHLFWRVADRLLPAMVHLAIGLDVQDACDLADDGMLIEPAGSKYMVKLVPSDWTNAFACLSDSDVVRLAERFEEYQRNVFGSVGHDGKAGPLTDRFRRLRELAQSADGGRRLYSFDADPYAD